MAMMSEQLSGLVASDVSVEYGGVHANRDIGIVVRREEIVGLIGPNGGGKTTFVDAVTGFTRSSGQVSVDGLRIDGMSAHERRRAGVARTWQAGELFGDLTIVENVLVAVRPAGVRGMLRDVLSLRHRGVGAKQAQEALEMVGLTAVAEKYPGEVSLGQQKLIGVARALVGGVRTILLDEPAAGLDEYESAAFGAQVKDIAQGGVGVLLIEHDVELVRQVCNRLYVVEFGRIIAEGRPAEVLRDKDVVAAYLGPPGEAD